MATETTQKPQTFGTFDIVGNVTVDDKTFLMSERGKNNPNWVMNIFNPKIEGNNGQSMFVRIQSGYDIKNGKTIYARSIADSSLEVAFGDRTNPELIKRANEKSFIKVGYKKELVKDDKGKEYMAWKYEKFLDSYDAIAFLQKIMPLASTQKIHIKGTLKFSEYNGNISKNFELQSIWILTNNEEEDKKMPLEFKFFQNVLLESNCLDETKADEGKVKLHTRLYIKEKKEYKVLPLDMIIPVNAENKEAKMGIFKKFFTIDEGKIRRIKLEGRFRSGMIQGNVTKDDLNAEALEMIASGLYTEEEVMKTYVNREFIDELEIIRPSSKKVDEKILWDMDDDTYTPDDLEGKETDIIEEVEVEEEEVNDLLNELENL